MDLLKAGTATLTLPPSRDGNSIAYGDYFGAALDPVDGTAWVVGEFVSAPNVIATWIGQIALKLNLAASVNQLTFAVGQTLIAGGGVTNPGVPEVVDFYVGVLLNLA